MPAVDLRRVRVRLAQGSPIPSVGAQIWQPTREKAGAPALILAHGAGTGMDSHLLQTVAKGVAEAGYPVMLFNFVYREAGRKAPDRMPLLESCYQAAIATAQKRFGSRPLLIGGRSMGGRVASHLAARGEVCAGLVFLGYPLHKAQRLGAALAQNLIRSTHWPEIEVPTLFVQGDRDTLAHLRPLKREIARRLTAPSTLRVVRGADHGFAVRAMDQRSAQEVDNEIIEAVVAFIGQLP